MLNDPLANALSKMLNYERNRLKVCWIKPVSSLVRGVLSILKRHGYVGDFKEIPDSKGNHLKLSLLGSINKCGAVKPRFNVKKDGFEKFEMRYLPARNVGILVVSTPQGLMTHVEAVERGLGGRLLAYCY